MEAGVFLVSGDNQPEIGEVGRGRETAPNQTEAAGGEIAWIVRRRTARSQEGWGPLLDCGEPENTVEER